MMYGGSQFGATAGTRPAPATGASVPPREGWAAVDLGGVPAGLVAIAALWPPEPTAGDGDADDAGDPLGDGLPVAAAVGAGRGVVGSGAAATGLPVAGRAAAVSAATG